MRRKNLNRSAKTPLMSKLMEWVQLSRLAREKGIKDVSELVEQRNWNRRNFIKTSVMAGAGLGLASVLPSCTKDFIPPSDKKHRIAVVGAGMAGLHAAYILKKAGFIADVFESSNRSGGRMYSTTDLMGPGLITEMGGEFIDSSHEDMIQLANEFGFGLMDTQQSSELSLSETFFFGGTHYSLAQVVSDFTPIGALIQNDIDQLPDFISYLDPGTAIQYDDKSISEYLMTIGLSGYMRDLLEVAYVTEYGLEADVQSCINLLYLIGTDTSAGSFDVFGESDERYKINGGNQKLTDALADQLTDQILFEHSLYSIEKSGDKYILHFDRGDGSSIAYKAEHVIMTVPFSVLRNVDLTKSGFSDKKLEAIEKLGYGTNAKLMMGFDERYWRTILPNYNGYYFTDNGAQSGWDNTQLQAGTAGGITVYSGGMKGVNMVSGAAIDQANDHLPLLNQMYPGLDAKFNNRVGRFHWPTHPHTKGSYACYKTGQWVTLCGAEGERAGNMLFAGEHCSFDFQGYMNGAAETGRVAAETLISELS